MARVWPFLGIAAISALGSIAQAAEQPPKNPCDAPEFHQLDFWIGHWKAYQTGNGEYDGESYIEPVFRGCAIRENWKDASGMIGGSYNAYNPRSKVWRQFWVESRGAPVNQAGGWRDGRMEFESTSPSQKDPNLTITNRMSLKPMPDKTVVQQFEASKDGGKTWKTVYELIYKPEASPWLPIKD